MALDPGPRAMLISVAAGQQPADLVLKNARIVQVTSHEVISADLALAGGRIAGWGRYESNATVDIEGSYVCPGFIDSHAHIESSLLDVVEFSRVASTCGTTLVVVDPHEFANVLGLEGIRRVLALAVDCPISVHVMLSSCVPASPLESGAATLGAEDLAALRDHPRVLGLAEMMNYPGVIHQDGAVLAKLDMAAGRVIDGHAPGLTGRPLAAYASAGIMSDHESTSAEEAAEKLRAGLHVMIREGSQTRNLQAILPLVRAETADRFMFCTDDKDVRDLLGEGHIDHMVRSAIRSGLDPILAVRLASLNAARYFGFRDVGAVAPGFRANLAIVDDLKTCRVRKVYHDGRLVAEEGQCIAPGAKSQNDPAVMRTVRVAVPSIERLRIPAPSSVETARVQVIEVRDGRIDTDRSVETLPVINGAVHAAPARDIAKLAVFERHRASGRVGLGFVRGFGLQRGAIGSTVAHDAHNLIVAGLRDEDILAAVERLRALQGGLVVASDGEIVAETPLPIAGLVSDRPAAEVAESLGRLAAAVRALGCHLAQPFMALAFLSLSVIGKLKLTDQGLVDVDQFRVIPVCD